MTPKTPSTTIEPSASAEKTQTSAGPADFAAQWQEARLVYPLYAALATQFDLAPLPYASGELPPVRPTREAFDGDLNGSTRSTRKCWRTRSASFRRRF